MPNRILDNGMFHCAHLSVSDEQDIEAFSGRAQEGEGLVNYIQHFAFPDEERGGMRTYIIRDNDTLELVGYFSLKAGLVSLNELETEEGSVFDTLPGVELANFAVNDRYIQRHPQRRGAGFVIFSDFVRPIVGEVIERIGVEIIYIFALPEEKLLRLYQERYGFMRLSRSAEERLQIGRAHV